ncbi:MAG: ABC transporter permease [Myxococcota bacterium]
MTRLGIVLLAAFALLAIAGPLLVGDPTAYVAAPHLPPSAEHWFGTTGQGQDVFAQTVAGAGPTLLVGFAAGLAMVAVGALVGAAAGYFGGWIDELLSLATNVFLVLPGLPLAVVVAAWLPPGPATLVAVLVFTGWAWTARVVRAQVQCMRKRDWVAAARLAGEPHWRVLIVEILPNLKGLVASAAVGATVYAIGAQVGLEFLGLGDPGAVTWGTNLYWAANDAALLTRSWWTFVPTGACVALVGFALALVNAGLDAAANPRLAAGNPLLDTEVSA